MEFYSTPAMSHNLGVTRSTVASQMKETVPRYLTSQPAWRNPLRKQEPAGLDVALDLTAPLLEPAEKRESVSDLIAKKREIFLVQIGLDIKLDEIAKLRDRAMQRDQALGKAEKLLDHDIKRFDDFLKEDAAKLQEALIHADTQTKAKQEKTAEIKGLRDALANARGELMRTEERLEDAKKLQNFLDELTPLEWKEGLVQARDDRHAAKLARWQAECDSITSSLMEAQLSKAAGEAAYEGARTQQEADKAQADIRMAITAIQSAKSLSVPPVPVLEPLDTNTVYFQEPRQLLAIFSRLEAQNLIVIQGMQDASAALEEAKTRQEHQKARLDTEWLSLQSQVLHLKETKTRTQEICSALKQNSQNDGDMRPVKEAWEVTQAELKEGLSAFFKQCGNAYNGTSGLVAMVAAMERRLDESMAAAAALPAGVAEEWQKGKEKERRQLAREQRKRQEADEYQARLARAIERAAPPGFKRSGKPSMTRSFVSKTKSQAQEVDAARLAEIDLQKYIDRPFPG